jgi:hypothetical protein
MITTAVIQPLMRSKLLAVSFLAFLTAGSAFPAIVVEKRGRQLPYVEIVDCHGIHAFIFRGPTGTSRRPILVPPREYWVAPEAGLYQFVLRYQDGHVCSRLVTPEVFARYNVGEDFRECPVMDNSQVDDSKTVQPVVHHRTRTAQMKNRKHSSHRVAKHRRHHPSRLVAQR